MFLSSKKLLRHVSTRLRVVHEGLTILTDPHLHIPISMAFLHSSPGPVQSVRTQTQGKEPHCAILLLWGIAKEQQEQKHRRWTPGSNMLRFRFPLSSSYRSTTAIWKNSQSGIPLHHHELLLDQSFQLGLSQGKYSKVKWVVSSCVVFATHSDSMFRFWFNVSWCFMLSGRCFSSIWVRD